MKTDIITFGILVSIIPIMIILFMIGAVVSNAPVYACVTQAIEAKISADDIQKICYRRYREW